MPWNSPSSSWPLMVLLTLVLTLAVWFDVRERRIPNWLTLGALASSVVLRGALGGEALSSGLLGGGLGFLLGIAFFAVGVMGAGDGKLLVAAGAILGLEPFLLSLPLIGIFGGLIVLGLTIRRGTLLHTILLGRELLIHVVTLGRMGHRRTLGSDGGGTVPYGVAIAMGAAAACLAWGISP